MDTHARTAKWSKGIPEMDVLSLAEQEMVCNKVAKQLFAICVTVVTLILMAFRLYDGYGEYNKSKSKYCSFASRASRWYNG